MLKFEGFEVGTEIRAYDFEPMEGRRDRYVDGVIDRIQDVPYKGYVITVTNDTAFPSDDNRVGLEVIVPMEMSMMDFDERVQQLSLEVA